MSEERKPAPPPVPGARDTSAPRGATDKPSRDDRADTSRPAEDDTSRVDGIDRVEFRRGLNDLRRHQQTVANQAMNDLGAMVIFTGLHVALAGYFLRSDAKRRQRKVESVDGP